jgi:WD40 repeat protein
VGINICQDPDFTFLFGSPGIDSTSRFTILSRLVKYQSFFCILIGSKSENSQSEMYLATASSDPEGADTTPETDWNQPVAPGTILPNPFRQRGGHFPIQWWDANSYEQVGTLTGHTNSIVELRFNHNGDRLASGGLGGTVYIWDVSARCALFTLPITNRDIIICSLCFSTNDDQLLTRNKQGEILRWDLSSQSVIQILKNSKSPSLIDPFREQDDIPLAFPACFCVNDTKIAAVTRGTQLMWWDVASGTGSSSYKKHEEEIMSMAVSPAGDIVATASQDGLIVIWDIKNSKIRHKLKKHKDSINCMCFNSTTSKLASGSDDSTVVIWDLNTFTAIVTINCGKAVCSVSFNDVGDISRLAIGINPDIVHIHDGNSGQRTTTIANSGGYACFNNPQVVLM